MKTHVWVQLLSCLITLNCTKAMSLSPLLMGWQKELQKRITAEARTLNQLTDEDLIELAANFERARKKHLPESFCLVKKLQEDCSGEADIPEIVRRLFKTELESRSLGKNSIEQSDLLARLKGDIASLKKDKLISKRLEFDEAEKSGESLESMDYIHFARPYFGSRVDVAGIIKRLLDAELHKRHIDLYCCTCECCDGIPCTIM